ncbi:hypothetical protein CEXT_62581 [Caerostris extrusa]|uniref:Uncharacterized protein n=1 Tax=Caerostris extrusa TaxID=172846 RepID=A0AAV4XEX5_CAEEX|nr:hypothetical protein CEXT_62581 [Caerostris extrusa]
MEQTTANKQLTSNYGTKNIFSVIFLGGNLKKRRGKNRPTRSIKLHFPISESQALFIAMLLMWMPSEWKSYHLSRRLLISGWDIIFQVVGSPR